MVSMEEDRALLGARIARVRERMAQACARVGRDPSEVRLLLATKTVPAERIRLAVDAGAHLLGENRIQEALGKFRDVPEAEWHFIGHLQTNKVRQALEFAKMIHSVDRPSLVEALDARLREQGRRLDVLLQVNTSYEASKFGVEPAGALELARFAAKHETLRVRGLMTIGPLSDDLDRVRRAYRLLRELRDELQGTLGDLPILSMGMSGDFELAIEEGATLVRVGTTVFGPRGTSDAEYWPEAGPKA